MLELIHKSRIIERFAHRCQICRTEPHAFPSFSLAFIEASAGVLLLCNHVSAWERERCASSGKHFDSDFVSANGIVDQAGIPEFLPTQRGASITVVA